MIQHTSSVASLDDRDLNVSTLREKISHEMKLLYPELKHHQIESAVEKYISAVIDELKRALLRPADPNNPGEFPFEASNLRAAGRITYQGRKTYIYQLMQNNFRTRLYEVKFAGQKGRYQRVVINHLYQGAIMNIIDNEDQHILNERDRQEIQKNFNRIIPVNSASLTGYITQTQQDLVGLDTTSGYGAKLSRNLLAAKTLLSQIETVDNQEIIREVWVRADSGRQYGRFNSLQRQSSQLREVVLGPCWKYDFKVCSFAVILSMAAELEPGIRRGAIAEYIRNRRRIRERIARETNTKPTDIKKVFTQLGFGARPINNPFQAIRQTMGTPESFERLMANQTFQWINEDLRAANQVILANFPEHDFTWLLNCKFTAHDPDTGRKKSDSQRLAWIYQNVESYLMYLFTEYVAQVAQLNPLLTVHDGVYYAQPIPLSTQQDLRYLLQQEYAYVNFEEEQVWPISTREDYAHRFDHQQAEAQAHLDRIAQEEQQAQGYRNEFMSGSSQSRSSKKSPTESAPESARNRATERAYTERIDPTVSEQQSQDRYDLNEDPWYQDLTEDEQKNYQTLRDQLTGHRREPVMPDWVKQRLGVQ